MESLGKSVTTSGQPGQTPGGALVWGGSGTEIQHSFFQWLHQGKDIVPVDFIGIGRHFASADRANGRWPRTWRRRGRPCLMVAGSIRPTNRF